MAHNPDMDDIDPPSGPLTGGPQYAVPNELRERLHPARWIVHEWAEYWLQTDPAIVASLRIGSIEVAATPSGSGNFRIRFENQLGLATIDVLDAADCLHVRHHLEVIAPKLGSADASLDFLEAILAALHQQVATAPFVLSAPAGRQVRDRHATRQPLFDLHFFRTHGATIRAAVQTVIGQPHRRLATEETLVLPHQVRQMDRVTPTRSGHPMNGPSS